MSNDMRIGGYMPALPSPGCCPDKVYALIFNHANQAMVPSGINYVFANYLAASIDDFDITTTEHSQRRGFFFADLPVAQVATILETPPDEPYWVEFWQKTGANPNQANDVFQTAYRFWWIGKKVVYSPLSVYERALLSSAKCHAAVAYDTANGLLKFVAWLERNGQRAQSPLSCEIKWLKRNGATIAHFTLVSYMAGMAGVFQAEQAVVDVDPDEATPIEVRITDSDNTVIVSSCAVTSWD